MVSKQTTLTYHPLASEYVVTLNGNLVNNVLHADSTVGVVLFVNGLGKDAIGVGEVSITKKENA